MLKQDDPKKCTAAKMVRFGLATAARKIAGRTILLNPFADAFLLPADKYGSDTVTAVDCSWNRADRAFFGRLPGKARRLPPLLAGNPINYAKQGRLTTAEALAAALYILGDAEAMNRTLCKFRWGHTFVELNRSLLNDYARLESQKRVYDVLAAHGMRVSPAR